MGLDFCGIPLEGKNCLPSYKVDLNFCGIPLEGKNCSTSYKMDLDFYDCFGRKTLS